MWQKSSFLGNGLNTTHVSVGEMAVLGARLLLEFKYNSCVGWRCGCSFERSSSSTFKYNSCVGWREALTFGGYTTHSFKYNSCVGWRKKFLLLQEVLACLNTTHVSVGGIVYLGCLAQL